MFFIGLPEAMLHSLGLFLELEVAFEGLWFMVFPVCCAGCVIVSLILQSIWIVLKVFSLLVVAVTILVAENLNIIVPL